MLLYQKTIDRSTLREGFQIPLGYHHILKASRGGMPQRGETFVIKILLDGEEYEAQLKNQKFNEEKFAGHSDVLQIRYSVNSPLAKKLREIFSSTWDYVEEQKLLPENANRKLTIPILEERQEYLALSTTELPNVFIADYVTCRYKKEIKSEIQQMNELDFETSFVARGDATATIKEVTKIQKIRHLDRSIGDTLKQLYNYRCQVTGERVGEEQGALCVEAHHIVPFTQSLNNDTSNIIILSPSYHRIVHKANPIFDSKSLSFVYPNGLVETVKLNKHLNA